MALIKHIPQNGPSTNDSVFFTVTASSGQSGATYRGWCYSNDGALVNKISGNIGYTLTGNDFSGYFNAAADINVTVKKAGTYLENKNGVVSIKTLAANDVIVVPNAGYAIYKLAD